MREAGQSAACETALLAPCTAAPAATPERSASAAACRPAAPAGYTPARLKRLWSLLFGTLVFLVALWVLRRWALGLTLEELLREITAVGPEPILLAVAFTALSFAALIGYEYYAVRFVRRTAPFQAVALYSFITQAIAHAVGFAILIGATVRYRLYGAKGFTFLDVMKIQLYFSSAFGLGMATLGGIVLLAWPEVLAAATGLAPSWFRLLGLLVLAGVAVILLLVSVLRRRLRLLGQVVELPEWRITLLLIALGIGDLAGIAATLHVLLPPELALAYHETLAILVAALALGLLSQVPGSLGVLEGAVLLLIAPPEQLTAALFGALILFRAIYYMLPLALGTLGLLVVELWRLGRGRCD